jgi:hypothetical protein
VYVKANGNFIMTGGKISENGGTSSAHANCGGGVFVEGIFSMSGGEISENTAIDGGGGGIYVSTNGTFSMSGGEVSKNISQIILGSGHSPIYHPGAGGGVYAAGTFTMNGGKISGNTAGRGGGVYVYYAIFLKAPTGGIIYGDTDTTHTPGTDENTSISSNGHAVYLWTNPILNQTVPWTEKRNSTADSSVKLDSSKIGAAGGWE